MDERYIMAIDLGTSKIVLTVAKVEGGDIRLVYYAESPSDGIRYSHVVNPAKAGKAIEAAVSMAEKELGIRCRQVVVGEPRYEVTLKDYFFSTAHDEHECVSAEDIRGLRDSAMKVYAEKAEGEEMLFGAAAQSFNCGDEEFQTSEKDVIGMTTKELGANLKLFVGQAKYIEDMDLAFRRAGDVKVLKRCFTPQATAKSVLYDTEMENGVALIDLGAGITSVSIHIGGVMRHYAAIPFGGRSVTMDIKSICAIPERLAENIKMAYGACMPDKIPTLDDKTLVIETDEALPSMHLPVRYLSEIITAREKEIINAVLYEIQESGFAGSLRSVVLTGGGAEMTNIAGLFKELSGYAVRIGYPRRGFFKTYMDLGPEGAAAMGMILLANEEEGLNCWSGPVPSEEEVEIVEDSPAETVFTPAPEKVEVKNEKKGRRERKAEKTKEKPVEVESAEGAEEGQNTERNEKKEGSGGGISGFFGNLFGPILDEKP